MAREQKMSLMATGLRLLVFVCLVSVYVLGQPGEGDPDDPNPNKNDCPGETTDEKGFRIDCNGCGGKKWYLDCADCDENGELQPKNVGYPVPDNVCSVCGPEGKPIPNPSEPDPFHEDPCRKCVDGHVEFVPGPIEGQACMSCVIVVDGNGNQSVSHNRAQKFPWQMLNY